MGAKHRIRRVELLLVFVAVGLLLASLGAVGNTARKKSQKTLCLFNQKQLVQGWLMFAKEHNGTIPVGYVTQQNYNKGYPLWCNPPLTHDWIYVGDRNNPPSLHDRLRGIRTGAIYPYIHNVQPYHCPADRRLYEGMYEGSGDTYKVFRSYSLPDILMGDVTEEDYTYGRSVHFKDIVKKNHTIVGPENKFAFVETNDYLRYRVYNSEAWSFIPEINLYMWWDPIGGFHPKGVTLSFCDGHAEFYQWQEDWAYDIIRIPEVPYLKADFDYFLWHYPINTPYMPYEGP